MSEPIVPREEARATLAARHELGVDFEDELVDRFVEKVEKRLETRYGKAARREGDKPFNLAVVSIVLGIPLTAIAGGIAGLPGLLTVWAGLVLINVVFRRL
jgi:hypothetical protein